ncbi:MAG: type II toxin-antitoxin system HipA family toxin [Alphaproteobacteria bacterium]|nr:type II toxin-antitoxin system HipA family toxin [Alphaproteobacteria bacterium]
MKAALGVRWDGRIAGRLTMDEHGDMGFVYDAAWIADEKARSMSQSLPKRPEPFGRREARPFFAGLLPEEAMREGAARALGVSEKNDFALLDKLGGDVAGALTLWPDGETPPSYDGRSTMQPLGDDALADIVDKLPERPLLAGRKGLRLSLAGAQAKLPVVLVEGRVALPAPGQPTTHILKPPIRRFPATTENEAFAMQLAAACKLDVAEARLRTVRDRPYLLVSRYDRRTDAQGRVHRVHQEDFCQALGIAPERKYAAEGGPTFKTSFALLRNVATRPAVEVLKLLDAALFNLVLGNADAHGKNFSLLYRSDTVALAPLYDLMCTAAIPGISTKLAMKLGEAAELKDFTPRTWEKFARAIELGVPFLRRRAKEIAELAAAHAQETARAIAADGFDRTALEGVANIVMSRADAIVRTL